MNPKLNKKVKKFLDAYFKGTSASSPEAHHALMFILKGALTDANFHSTSKKVDNYFQKLKMQNTLVNEIGKIVLKIKV